MIEVVLASNNKKKIRELQTLIDTELSGKICVKSLGDIGFEGDIDEYGDTFEANSLIKASAAAKLGYIGIADDSGLCVDVLDGEPGVYSARYAEDTAGFDTKDAANNAKLLRKLENTADCDRGAGFVCVASLVLPENSEIKLPEEYLASHESAEVAGLSRERCAAVRGECRGVILREARGESGFGYDPLFLSDELQKSFAEATDAEKNSVSHRGRAMREFAKVIAAIVK